MIFGRDTYCMGNPDGPVNTPQYQQVLHRNQQVFREEFLGVDRHSTPHIFVKMGVGIRKLLEKYPKIGKNWVGGRIFSTGWIFAHTFPEFFSDPPCLPK